MTVKGFIALAVFIAAITASAAAAVYIYNIGTEMEDILYKSINYIEDGNFDKAEDKFNEFTGLYENNKALLSVLINDSHIKNINISVEKIANNFKSEFEETLLTEIKELAENVGHIYNDYKLTIENIL